MKILKYTLGITEQQFIAMPEGAKIICIQAQRGTPTIWVEADLQKPIVNRRILMIRTGWDMPEILLVYIGTTQGIGFGGLDWHFYEVLS